MKKFKKNNGITLISLVITIIVLLILAGITINLTIGQDGIIKRSEEAGRNYQNAADYERRELGKLTNVMENTIGDTTISSFEELLLKNGIYGTYSKEDFANNKDGILEIVLKNDESIEYIFNHAEEYVDILTSSQEAMRILGQNKTIKEKVITNDTWCEKIANSEYRSDFSEYIVYNANSLLGTAISRKYYKRNDGCALGAAFTRNGANFMLVSKEKEPVIGYWTYNSSRDSVVYEIEYHGEIWYYAVIPYGGANNESITSTKYCKRLGRFSTFEEVAKYVIDDYLEFNQ